MFFLAFEFASSKTETPPQFHELETTIKMTNCERDCGKYYKCPLSF